MEAQGSEGLVAIIDSLPSVLQAKPVTTDQLNRVLADILSAQARKDHLYMADLIEHELLTLFRRYH